MAQADKKQMKTGSAPVVLIVDADHSFLEKLEGSLHESFSVHTATSGIEAIHLIKILPQIDVLIVNEKLPRMKASELFRFVHEMFRNSDALIKILITQKPAEGSTTDLNGYGRIDCCCVKPVEPEAMRRKISYLLAQKSREKRTSMRITPYDSSDIRIDTDNCGEAEVIDISENGMFLKTMSFYPEGASLPLKITLPDGTHYSVSGRIVRQDIDRGGIGIEFQAIDDQGRHSILQFLSEYVTLRDLDELKLRYPFLKTDKMVLFSDPELIESLLRQAMQLGFEIVAIPAQSRIPEILGLSEIRPHSACVLSGENLNIKFKTADLLFVSFQIGYATYNFETMVSRIAADGESLKCLYPRAMFYSEKRAAPRIQPLGEISVEIVLPQPFEGALKGKIIDIGREGMAFTADSLCPALLAGTPLPSLKILEDGRFLWEEKGEIRYVTRLAKQADAGLRYGVQFGIGRMNIQASRAPEIGVSFPRGNGPSTQRSRSDLRETGDPGAALLSQPDVIRLENGEGEEIVGLLNTSIPLDGDPVPVVLIPPAFGKTKESLFGLALTITQNFQDAGKPVAVFRYDGIRRKGESHKDPDASEPPFEMLKATLTQGAEDIKTVLDWLQLNPSLSAGQVILVTFSLSALEARIALRDEAYRRRVDYWISCLGTLEFRNLMNRVNCGLDLLEQYQIGIDLGIIPILGNLINMVPYAADVVSNRVATIDQAREDMRHLDVPITWIYGKYDSWITPDLIRDVMSIKADAPREVIAVPVGHNARTSEEALRMFGLITSLVHRSLHKDMIRAALPTKPDLEIMRRSEKDRLPPRKLDNRQTYWRRYLIGEENLLGFDVMALSDDYNQLLDDQVLALDLASGDRLLDLGGGTGNVIAHLLENGGAVPAHITIADLIPEALKQAREKLAGRLDPGRFDLLCLDIELNRFLPIQRYLAGEIGTFVELSDKIDSLDLTSAMKIHKEYTPRLHRILRGEPISPEQDVWLKTRHEPPEYNLIVDFNRAARYVRGIQTQKPEFRKLGFPGSLDTNPSLPLRPGSYNKILMSLVLSYIFNPLETLRELRRIIAPGGRLVLSSMRPDTDASGPFTRLLDKIDVMPADALPPQWPKALLLDSIRSFLNDAQALVDLEEAGTFDFFDPEKLGSLLEDSGWLWVQSIPTFGEPPQGYVVIAEPRDTHD